MEYISKHEAYTMMKDLEAAYIYPPVKEAYATAARRIDQMKAADVQPVDRWISVKDRLPEENESVLICTFTGSRSVATRFGDRFFVGLTASFVKEDVTHWQPLPEPPQE